MKNHRNSVTANILQKGKLHQNIWSLFNVYLCCKKMLQSLLMRHIDLHEICKYCLDGNLLIQVQ